MFLWDVLFPRRCLGCGRFGSYVCLHCANSLKPVQRQTCLYCGRPSLWGLTHPDCRKKDGVDASLSLYYYDINLKKIIAGIKYRLVREAFSDLLYIIGRRAAFLTEAVRGLDKPHLQPVPQSRGRKNERGFNQAEIISRIFSSLLPLTMVNVLVKGRDTPPQASLTDRCLRKGNLRGVFSVKRGAGIPTKIMLIDDVVTTGETVKEAARVLKRAGVRKVYVLSVAKG